MRRDREAAGDAVGGSAVHGRRILVGRKLALAALIGLAACGGGEEQPERDPETTLRQARADSVAQAEARYDPAAFDTIQWESWSQRAERGRLVYNVSCRKCHGTEGRGDGETATRFQLEVPSLVSEDWSYAGDQAGIRRRVYVGHESEMPTWGLYGLEYRDIDAVALYVDEVLGENGGG